MYRHPWAKDANEVVSDTTADDTPAPALNILTRVVTVTDVSSPRAPGAVLVVCAGLSEYGAGLSDYDGAIFWLWAPRAEADLLASGALAIITEPIVVATSKENTMALFFGAETKISTASQSNPGKASA